MITAINKIEIYTKDYNFEQFSNDDKTLDAVLRNLEIIGEAASHVPAHIQEKFSDIPWRKIKNFRNILAHEYFGIDIGGIWETIQNRLAILKNQLEVILA